MNPTERPSFICPACHSELTQRHDAYRCSACNRRFPVLFGIPDFRLRSDPYLSLSQERLKAKKINESKDPSFEGLLRYYYKITNDVPAELAYRYIAYHRNNAMQAQDATERLDISGASRVLDAGCGTGGGLIACSHYTENLTGVDIALRWLVICKRRLDEAGIKATLVCADVESLPFSKESFDRILATDLLDNVYDVDNTLKALHNQIQPGGRIWLTGSNRYSLGPHPSTRIWGIGFLPAAFRRAVLKKLRGVDSLRFSNLLSPGRTRRGIENLGGRLIHFGPKKVNLSTIERFSPLERRLIRLYLALTASRLCAGLMLRIGPAFEGMFTKDKDLQG